MIKYLVISLLFFITPCHADTIINYMNIANNIPKMEMKADSESQAWARSARNVLLLTADSIAETVTLMNENNKDNALFCMPHGVKLDGATLDNLIQKTYQELTTTNKNAMSVSQIALIGLTKQYPCKNTAWHPIIPLINKVLPQKERQKA